MMNHKKLFRFALISAPLAIAAILGVARYQLSFDIRDAEITSRTIQSQGDSQGMRLIHAYVRQVPSMPADVHLVLDSAGSIAGVTLIGPEKNSSGSVSVRRYTLAQLKQGVEIEIKGFTAAKIKASPNFDAARGGDVGIKYRQGLFSYGNVVGTLQRQGDRWIAISDAEHGRIPFTEVMIEGEMNGTMIYGLDGYSVR